MSYQLRVLSGEPADGVFPLAPGENVVGRAPDCAVVLESAGVSRQHFMIRVADGRAVLENKGRFGTQVDERPVDGPVELRPGQQIRFGMYMLVQFEEAGAGAAADPDQTSPMPAFYTPELHQAPRPQAGADDSFFLRNDDVALPPPSSARANPVLPPPPAPDPDLEGPESGIILRPGAVMDDEGAGMATDPSALEFPSGFKKQAASRRPPPAPEPSDDSGLFSSPAALPSFAKGHPVPPPKSLPPAPAPSPSGKLDDGNHTRGLSPEAIAFMRQEWERKAKGRNGKWIILGVVIVLAAAAATYLLMKA